jgi:hypothetical protein
VLALIFVGLATHALGQGGVSRQDRSRFEEHPYKTAEPGMLPPSVYIELAKQAVHRRYKDVHFNMYSDGKVTRRFYRDAPVADRDVICVQFGYLGYPSGGGVIGRGFVFERAPQASPVIQALIRKDRSKIYLTVRPSNRFWGFPRY